MEFVNNGQFMEYFLSVLNTFYYDYTNITGLREYFELRMATLVNLFDTKSVNQSARFYDRVTEMTFNQKSK